MRHPSVLSGLCLAGLLLGPGPVGAMALGDDALTGYSVVSSTIVPGNFTGCIKNQAVAFADSTRFVCGRTSRAMGYDVRVVILRRGAERSLVVLIGGHPYVGAILQLGDREVRPALPVDIPEDRGPVQSQDQDRIQPIQPVVSLNTLQAVAPTPLEQQQDQPVRARPGNKAR